MTVDDRLSNIEKAQKDMLDTLTYLKMGIMGSEKIGVEGMASKVNRHEAYIEKDKKQKWMIGGGIAVISFIITLILTLLK